MELFWSLWSWSRESFSVNLGLLVFGTVFGPRLVSGAKWSQKDVGLTNRLVAGANGLTMLLVFGALGLWCCLVSGVKGSLELNDLD